MDDQTWAFTRNNEHLELTREGETAALLRVTGVGRPRTYRFDSPDERNRFQRDMEAMLLATGWAIVGFSPERRAGRDRRTWPRLTERRRWWTDGVRQPSHASSRS